MQPHETTSLPPVFGDALEAAVADWERGQKVARLWARDSTLWTGADEDQWLGWLHPATSASRNATLAERVSSRALKDAFDDVVLLGMGGSSLCAEVLASSFGPTDGCPTLRVLDSTDPAQIRSCEEQIALDRTLFLTSSKSGSTLESSILLQYFLDRVQQTVGLETAGDRFVAITDPGSPLETVATQHRFRAVFHGVPDIGGRFSALSVFGTIPAAAMGIDVEKLGARADEMRARSTASVPVRENPGVMLGLVLGVLARSGRDKVTFLASPSVAPLGAWVEQLLAESTGKQGHGLIPVDGETLASPERYRADRVFVYLRDEMAPDQEQESALTRIEDAGQPVIRLALRDPHDLGAEFFRWELATAVLGAELGINPFDQPDVEASKLESRRLTAEYETTGSVPRGAVVARNGTVQVLGDTPIVGEPSGGGEGDVDSVVAAHLDQLRPGDYLAVLAYVERNARHTASLQRVRHVVRDVTGNATCLGFGPRFLHSTGQVHKGGPNTGVFLQITCDDVSDIAIRGQRYTFGVVKAAQAAGDLAVLRDRNRRVLHLHVTGDVGEGLERIAEIVSRAVPGTDKFV